MNQKLTLDPPVGAGTKYLNHYLLSPRCALAGIGPERELPHSGVCVCGYPSGVFLKLGNSLYSALGSLAKMLSVLGEMNSDFVTVLSAVTGNEHSGLGLPGSNSVGLDFGNDYIYNHF